MCDTLANLGPLQTVENFHSCPLLQVCKVNYFSPHIFSWWLLSRWLTSEKRKLRAWNLGQSLRSSDEWLVSNPVKDYFHNFSRAFCSKNLQIKNSWSDSFTVAVLSIEIEQTPFSQTGCIFGSAALYRIQPGTCQHADSQRSNNDQNVKKLRWTLQEQYVEKYIVFCFGL